MQAFGPYGGRQVLDFAALGRFGFFLIHGPTGAGKTTILDAMAFALYGDTSGAEREPRDMRSDHADPALRTEVTLDFSVGDKRYRVQRSPWQQRPKLRGDGFTTENATAHLWDRSDPPAGESDADDRPVATAPRDAEGRPLAHKPTDVTERIEQILGFRSVQFRQVVMLPQGKFQELLQSSGKEREEILQRLFRTERYRELQDALKDDAQAIEREVQQAVARRAGLLSTVGAIEPDEVGERLGRLVEQVAEGEAAAALAAVDEQSALAALNAAQTVAAAIDELGAARAASDELAAGAPEIAAVRAEVALARKAEPLAGYDRRVHDRRNDLTPRLLELELAEGALDRAVAARRKAEAALEAETARAAQRVALADQVRELAAMADKAGALSQAAAAFGAAEAALKAAARADTQAAKAGRAALKAAQAAVDRAAGELADLETAWASGQAAVLAASLEPGAACPVCGATDHPAPALPQGELPSEADVLDKRAQVAELRRAHEMARDAADKAAAGTRRELADATAAQAGAVAVLEERSAGVPDDLRDANEVARRLAGAQDELTELERAWTQAQADDRATSESLATATATLTDKRHVHDELAAAVAALEAERLAGIAQAGFADEKSYFAARREPQELAALVERVAGYDSDVKAAGGGGGGGRRPGAAPPRAPPTRLATREPRSARRATPWPAPPTTSPACRPRSAPTRRPTRSSAGSPRWPTATTTCASRSSATCWRPTSTTCSSWLRSTCRP
jgi:exonuclease SbcC